jgi:hypothetical protein
MGIRVTVFTKMWVGHLFFVSQTLLAEYIEDVVNGGGQDLTAALVSIAFGDHEEATEHVTEARQKRAQLLLDKMLGRTLERVLNGTVGDHQLGWLGCTHNVPAATAAAWASHAVRSGTAF